MTEHSPSIIDLHTHSVASDGELTAVDLLTRAAENSVDILSITDHDTLDGYTTELFKNAEDLGIELIPGIEISCENNDGIKVHVLGHFIDPANQAMQSWLEELRENRLVFAERSAEKLQQLGWTLAVDELLSHRIVSKAHIADAVITHPANHAKLLIEFGYVPSRGEFIETIMNSGRPGHVDRIRQPSPSRAIEMIHAAGGTSTLAHPVASIYEQKLTIADIKDLINGHNFDGVESIYYYYSKSNGDALVDMVQELSVVTAQLGKIAVGGSDFHGTHRTIGNFVDVGMNDRAIRMDAASLAALRHQAQSSTDKHNDVLTRLLHDS